MEAFCRHKTDMNAHTAQLFSRTFRNPANPFSILTMIDDTLLVARLSTSSDIISIRLSLAFVYHQRRRIDHQAWFFHITYLYSFRSLSGGIGLWHGSDGQRRWTRT